ncbi:UNVERIFIED_CONTAM: Dr1-associated corepressor, partial [Sesamum indicum]
MRKKLDTRFPADLFTFLISTEVHGEPVTGKRQPLAGFPRLLFQASSLFCRARNLSLRFQGKVDPKAFGMQFSLLIFLFSVVLVSVDRSTFLPPVRLTRLSYSSISSMSWSLLARIKKIMQADEDVGKIAMAVPVLVSKALELFLQDLCDRTYGITIHRGAKTVSSLHLKQCVHSYNVFDFLREVVSKVPDYGNSDAAADTSKRRKVVANESNDSDEELKRGTM